MLKTDTTYWRSFAVGIGLIMAMTYTSKAQTVYGTTNGVVQITGLWNDSSFTARSNQLGVILNYETAAFQLRLDKSTLVTGIDSLDKLLSQSTGHIMHYEGTLGIEYIKTQKHPPLDFDVEGFLTCNPHYERLAGKGRLVHIFGDYYSCILNLTFHINLKETDLGINLPGLSDDIHVEIVQTVLKPDNE